MGTGEIDFGEDDDEPIAPSCSAASASAKSSCPAQKPPKKAPKARVAKEPLKLEPMERPKRRSVLLAEKLIARCNEEVQFLYDSKTDPSFRCSLPARFRKPKKEEPVDFCDGCEQTASTSAGAFAAESMALATLEGQVKRSSREAMCILDELRRSKESPWTGPTIPVRAFSPSHCSEGPSVCGPLARRTSRISSAKPTERYPHQIPMARRSRAKQPIANDMRPSA